MHLSCRTSGTLDTGPVRQLLVGAAACLLLAAKCFACNLLCEAIECFFARTALCDRVSTVSPAQLLRRRLATRPSQVL